MPVEVAHLLVEQLWAQQATPCEGRVLQLAEQLLEPGFYRRPLGCVTLRLRPLSVPPQQQRALAMP
ncbi:hypothetical protein A4F85_01115 [Delftia sp. GW456-R20]|nr:hypothetical protein A4F85_01115 [Delftia sp. GW456-R20]